MIGDIEISQAYGFELISDVAERAGIRKDELDRYGKYKAKIDLSILKRLDAKPRGKYVLVTAATPNPKGEGKTVNTIGLSMALNHIGRKAIACIRQPSMGPIFGIKGGAAGGGYSQVVPMEEFNLHLTGDMHAVGAAHNLLAAVLDNHILYHTEPNIDPLSISWPRTVDMNDRVLRDVAVGLGGPTTGVPRETGYAITPASEVMAILSLCENLQDLREKLGRIVVGFTYEKEPVTAEDLKCAGAMAAILKETVKPTVMQTLSGTAAFIHAGPFANIATGCSSIIADRVALGLADYVITEAGFGADMGAEKFFNIKCRMSGLVPDAAALVVTVIGLKVQSGLHKIRPNKPLTKKIKSEDLQAVEKGCANLAKQIENVCTHGVPVVVVVNRRPFDTDAEIELIKRKAVESGARSAVVSEVFSRGAEGGVEFAEAIVEAADTSCEFKHLYELDLPIGEKIGIIAKRMYGAGVVHILKPARRKIRLFEKCGFGKLPICMAKTPLSLSHDPTLTGRPEGFKFPVMDVNASIGAGFIYPLAGEISTMPGLPKIPSAEKVDIAADGRISGLF